MAALLQNIIIGKHYGGVEIFSQAGTLAFLEVQQKRDELIITGSAIYENFDNLFAKKYKLPIALIVNNEHVLHREVDGTDPNDKKLLNKAFPNIAADDFYYEIWRRDTASILAICRKAYIDGIVTTFNTEMNIASVSLGILSMSTITGFNLPPIITTNTQQIIVAAKENSISAFCGEEQSYDINGITITNKYLQSFSAILRFMLPAATTGSITALSNNLFEKFRQKAFFDKGLKTGIGIILGILLINFILFSYFFDKAAAISQTVAVNKADIETIAQLKNKIKDKEQKLKTFAGNSASASSVIINDFVKKIPQSLLLTEIIYHPLQKKVKDEEAVIILDSVVTITGATLSNEAFTGWVQQMQKSKWVKDVTITSFGRNTENETVFSLNIILKNEVKQEK